MSGLEGGNAMYITNIIGIFYAIYVLLAILFMVFFLLKIRG